MKKIRIFNLFRYLSIAAIVCTVTLAAILFSLCATPGAESSKQSQAVANTLESAMSKGEQTEHVNIARITIVASGFKFVGETERVKITCSPSGASADYDDFIFSSSNANVLDINEEGVITYKKCGLARIYAKLKSDETIQDSIQLECAGSKDIGEIGGVVGLDGIKEGDNFRVTLKSADGQKSLSSRFCKVDIEDRTIVDHSEHIWLAKKAGTTNVTFYLEGSAPYTKKITVASNPAGVPINFSFKPQEHENNENNVYYANYLDTLSLSKIIASEPSTAAIHAGTCSIRLKNLDSGKSASVKMVNNRLVAVNSGRTELTVTSYFNPDCKIAVTIVVREPTPSKLNVMGNSWVVVDEASAYRATFNGADIRNVTWSVLRGKATISENGVITPTKTGKLVLRVTYNKDPSVYRDIEVRVSLFTSFGLFVRKIMGHFMLFAILGFGLFACFFMLAKPRGLSPLFAAATGFVAAGFSEILQLPAITPGRVASWTDVMIDFTGVMIGITTGVIAVALYVLIRRRSANFAYVKLTVKNLNVTTIFKKAMDMPLYSECEYARSSEDGADPASANGGNHSGDSDNCGMTFDSSESSLSLNDSEENMDNAAADSEQC